MLQETTFTLINDRRLRPDAIAFDKETGANLIKSRRMLPLRYTLIIPNGDTDEYCEWPNDGTLTDDDVFKLAQTKLNEIYGTVKR
jgi:hypothetical protein